MVINWGKHIRKLRTEQGMTQAELAARSGLLRSHISRIESGAYKNPTQETFQRLARGLSMTPNRLTQVIEGRAPSVPPETPEQILERLKLAQPLSVPVYTEFPFHAGGPASPVEYVYRARPKVSSANIEGYIVHGNCLEPAVYDGDIIIVDREAPIDNGDIIACLLDDELRIGRLQNSDGELWLETNLDRLKLSDCLAAAPVIEVIRRLK
ncbi:MAG: LexA family transcriptional regulator [Chloroflexota bacterium]